MAQADLKATHYTSQLQNALLRGLWADSAPANAAKGQPMSWSELIRKFQKYCRSRHITAELALQTQSLSILLLSPKTDAKNVKPEDLDGDSDELSGSLALGNECELVKERVDDARQGFAALELLNDTPEERDSTLFTRAYFAYALKRYKECLALLNPMNFDEDITLPSRSSRLQVPSGSSTPSTLSAGTAATHLTWTGSIASVDVDTMNSKMWRMVEIVRGRCLQGMAMEKLGQEEDALKVYRAALPLLQNLRISHSNPARDPQLVDPSFLKYRELWRWTERLLWRASCLASRLSSINQAMTVFRAYATQAQYFPPTFRPIHRSVVTALHLQALLVSFPGSSIVIPGQTRLSWITEARTLLGEYRMVLAKCTTFPRAGERNVHVEEYCDGVVAVWERSGARGKDAQWAIEILWWASRMTFHSHRIFRHLTRLLHAAEQNELAERCLKLYVQLVTKSRQASLGEVETAIRKRRNSTNTSDEPADGETVQASTGVDDDRQFVDCLIFGARMLCRLKGGVQNVKYALHCLVVAKDVLSKNSKLDSDRLFKAKLSCATGVVDSTLAYREVDPTTRPILMRSALDHFASAVALNPESADAYYHLGVALLHAGPTRDLNASVQAARHAVELKPNEIRYWHLLGLSLSASGQYGQARDVLEIGEGLGTEEEDEVSQEVTGTSAEESTPEDANPQSSADVETLLPANETKAPSPSQRRADLPDYPTPSKEDSFEHGLELRITLLTIIEFVEGAEVASVKWVEVFAWFAERGGWAQPPEERRGSFELPPINTIPTTEIGDDTDESGTFSPFIQVVVGRSASATNLPSSGLPITIVPPTPNENGDTESVHTVRLSNEKEKDEEHSVSRKKKAQRIIKEEINKRQTQIQTISRKLGRNNTLRSQMSRANSTPDFTILGDSNRTYQASSIHSRQRMSPRASYIGPNLITPARTPPPVLAQIVEKRTPRERRLIAELWLTSAATFRRMGRLEQAKEAIQEAEGLEEGHPGVWVQLGLYFVANGEPSQAVASFHKALVIDPDHIPAVVHLAQQYLDPTIGQTTTKATEEPESRRNVIDLAAGMLSSFTKGPGWDVPEAWYLLAKAVSLQGRKERERECLTYALGLVEGKPIRDIRTALDFPPKKSDVLSILGMMPTPGALSESPPALRRCAEVDFINLLDGLTHNVVLVYEDSNWVLKMHTILSEDVHPQITPEELNEADEAVRRNPEVIKLAADIGVTPEQLHADGWSIGYDDRFPAKKRLQQCLLFARYGEHENLYAHPLDFFPVLDSNTFEVVHIDFAAHRKSDGTLSTASTKPAGIGEDRYKICGRERIQPPTKVFEYLPDKSGLRLREDLKPLHILQPEGPSFKVDGHIVEWQKWKMHVAFTGREGIAISTVTYNDEGNIRPLFYRLSLAEMVVPYAETAAPHARKFAFDVGEYGMGTQGNDLSLGCDCLGTIHYMARRILSIFRFQSLTSRIKPGSYIGHSGEPITINKAICIHEEDDGILWKHTDFRPGGRSHVVRSRRLVISMVATVANYEYAWYYYFGQDGSISFAIRLTGILNVYVLAPGELSAPFGSTVAPQINAHYHQHIFSFRIDPCIDGPLNTLLESDIVPLNSPTGSAENWAGNGFLVNERVVKTAAEGGRSYDFAKDRRWTIVNRGKKHYANGKPSGYGLMARGVCTELMAKPDSWVARRAKFATKSLWVVKDDDANPRMWPAGKYVPQTRDHPADSVGNWCSGDESLEDQDLVLFLTMGINHIPHPEQWPVMPVEKLEVTLKPINFFDQNPALDVPSRPDPKSSEYWVSQKKYWCKYCEIFIADDAPSRSLHENGQKHQGNRERFIRSLYKSGEKKKREEAEEKKELARIEREAQAAFAGDVQTGLAKASSSGGTSVLSRAIPAPKPAARQAITMANYTTAKDLGIAQEEEELAAKALALQQSQGVVGQWEIVESMPSTSETSAIPQKRPHEEDDEEGEGFRVRRRKLQEGLGEIYDPGIIKIIPKVKPEDEKAAEVVIDSASLPRTQEPALKWTTKRWKTEAVDEAASDGEEHTNTISKAEGVDVSSLMEEPLLEANNVTHEEPPSEVPRAEDAEVAAPAKSMFKKRKAPSQAVGMKKGVRKQL
ncbi:hypothetical protein FRC17_009318 [Serendipita sp. 399]|nr:hypothetical protein FRC17_009318 [Serendipita sp. 399]